MKKLISFLLPAPNAILLCLFFSISCADWHAQTFHGIIFANTDDKTIGASATKNTENIKNLMSRIASGIKFKLDLTICTGKQYTHETLDSVLRNFKADSGDVVFFYINSHGYKSSTGSDFPRVVIHSKTFPDQYLVSADTINLKLKQKSVNPNSVVTVIQACNRLTSRSKDLPLTSKGLTDFSEQNYKALFLSKLNIMVTSSQRGKTSIATPKKGSHFTQSFVKAMTEEPQNTNPSEVTWESVLKKARAYSLMLNKKRQPVWNIKPL